MFLRNRDDFDDRHIHYRDDHHHNYEKHKDYSLVVDCSIIASNDDFVLVLLVDAMVSRMNNHYHHHYHYQEGRMKRMDRCCRPEGIQRP